MQEDDGKRERRVRRRRLPGVGVVADLSCLKDCRETDGGTAAERAKLFGLLPREEVDVGGDVIVAREKMS